MGIKSVTLASAIGLLATFAPASVSMASYTTVGGRTLKDVKVGYETYGTLNAAGDNAILVPHFFFGESHTGGRSTPDDAQPGLLDADNKFAVEAWFDDAMRARAKTVDANNFITLVRAVQLFRVGDKPTLEEGLSTIKEKVLLIPSKSDLLLFPAYSQQAKTILETQGRSVELFEIDSPLGHHDGLFNIAKVGETIRAFLSR